MRVDVARALRLPTLGGSAVVGLMILIASACTGSQGPVAKRDVASEPVPLEVAVRDAARALAPGVLALLAPGDTARVAVAPLTSGAVSTPGGARSSVTDFGRFVADQLSSQLQQAGGGRLELVEREYLPEVFADLDRFEHDDEAAKRLLQSLGVRFLVVGRYTALDDRVVLNVRAVELATAAAVSATSVAVARSPDLVAMIRETPSAAEPAALSVDQATASLVRSLLAALGEPPPGTRAAVAELTTPDRERSQFGRLLAERLQTELTKEAGKRFPVIERRKIDALEEEGEGFANRKLDTLMKKMGATMLLIGTYSAAADRAFVDVRLVDPASAESRVAASVNVLVDADVKRLLGARVEASAPKDVSLGGPLMQVLADSGSAANVQVDLKPDRGEGGRYKPGETVTFSFKTTADAYVTILDLQTSGRVYTLFPNCLAPDNHVRGGQTYTIPAPSDGYDIEVSGPPGIERLKAFASTRPLPLTDPPLCARESFGSIAPTEAPRFRDLRLRVKEVPASAKATANTWITIQ